jgi:hypothetical protein
MHMYEWIALYKYFLKIIGATFCHMFKMDDCNCMSVVEILDFCIICLVDHLFGKSID